MANTNEILERILLNMKYDSKKTLSENKSIILNEESLECENIRLKHKKEYSKYKKGAPRAKDGSDKYGNWGDGKGLCCNKPGYRNGTYHKDCTREAFAIPGKAKWNKPGIHSPRIDKAIEVSKKYPSQWNRPLTKKDLISTYDYNGKKLEFFGHIIETVGDFFNPILEKINNEGENSYRDQRNGMWIPYSDANELKNGTGFRKDINYNNHRIKNVEGGWKYVDNMVWKYKDRTNCIYFDDTNLSTVNSARAKGEYHQDDRTCFIVDQAEKCRTYLQSKIYKRAINDRKLQTYDGNFNRNVEYHESFLDPPGVLDCVKKSTENLINRLGEKTPYQISVYLPEHARMGYQTSWVFTLVFEGARKVVESRRIEGKGKSVIVKQDSLEVPYKEGIKVLGYLCKNVPLETKKYGKRDYDIYLDYQNDNNIEHTEPYKINDICLWLKNPNSKYYYKKGWDYDRLVNEKIIADTPNNKKTVNDCLSHLNDLDLLNGGLGGDQTKPKIEGEKDGNVNIPNAIDINLKGNSDDITPRKGGTITLQLSGG